MEERTLGKQGLTVSALGYGAMGTAIATARPTTSNRLPRSVPHTISA